MSPRAGLLSGIESEEFRYVEEPEVGVENRASRVFEDVEVDSSEGSESTEFAESVTKLDVIEEGATEAEEKQQSDQDKNEVEEPESVRDNEEADDVEEDNQDIVEAPKTENKDDDQDIVEAPKTEEDDQDIVESSKPIQNEDETVLEDKEDDEDIVEEPDDNSDVQVKVVPPSDSGIGDDDPEETSSGDDVSLDLVAASREISAQKAQYEVRIADHGLPILPQMIGPRPETPRMQNADGGVQVETR